MKRLSYANVISLLVIFLALGGASAFAASQLAKNSVGTKQLKKNSVTAKKIKKNAVTAAKIKAKAVTAAKIKDAAVTGAKINAGSTSFSQVTSRLRNTSPLAVGGEPVAYPVGTFTQAAGEAQQYLGAVDVTFDAGCGAPRTLIALALIDSPNPGVPLPQNTLGITQVVDESAGTVTKRGDIAGYAAGFAAMSRAAPAAAEQHTISFLIEGFCGSGSGITVSGAGFDVIGTK